MTPAQKKRNKRLWGNNAYMSFWSGKFIVSEYPTQVRIASGERSRDVLRRARLKGYHVRLYGSMWEPSKVLPPL